MTDKSQNNISEIKILVPAWDRASLEYHGKDKAIAIIPDMGFLDDNYDAPPQPSKPLGLFSRFRNG
jgi:hypothetical protein